MSTRRFISSILCALFLLMLSPWAVGADWKNDRIWNDGLVEKAVYRASRVVYGKPRAYEAIVFTNKEHHDRRTLTKADKSRKTVEVFKHNQIEDIPTPNYTYHYAATSHLTTDDLVLTRLDVSSQEFCGTSFKQYQWNGGKGWDYWSFSYFPEAGRKEGSVRQRDRRIVAQESLPLALRDFDFSGKGSWRIALLPSQKSNRPTSHEPVEAEVRYAGEDGDAHKLELVIGGKVEGTYWMAKDRLHVMTRYKGADGQEYELKDAPQRVNYWTIKGE